ncbi:glycerophosphodiester phosphodiesterase [Nocardioides panacis]|uniref:Glycerophosphodiester phosphodiesterase n=1 Tax=Nocardioides panacis TaxID=2849501 RepID=A0A975SYW1_9ACTN|nr:glycerophosphodiester phosphodiesterase [Nocardioides panacis]QWZ08386.1 glycerophosphodiester phosphodiesterase [Nocardioides panacis]
MTVPVGTVASRRAFLAAAGAGIVTGVTGCRSVLLGDSSSGASAAAGSVEEWVRSRRAPYFIAHRGEGDVYPEHTMPSYRAAVDAGARALEVSTSSSKDDVLVCMHDLTLDRTTNTSGPVKARSWAELQDVAVVQPQLGPRWTTPPLTRIPSLEEVLEAFAGKTVLCLEAKVDIDYPLLVELVEKRGLQKSVVFKFFHMSSRIADAKAAGYPVFVYLGSDDASEEAIRDAASGLDRTTDYLVLPTTTLDGADLPDAAVRTAVGTGVSTWVYPVHRRSEAKRYQDLGAEGIITSSLEYVRETSPLATSDQWASKAIAPGEMTRHPDRAENGPSWTSQDELTLARDGAQRFLTLGQLAPVANAQGRYSISFEARWNKLPTDVAAGGFTLAFGHVDDAYYEHRLGAGDGYHAICRADGSLSIFSHTRGSADGFQLSGTSQAPIRTGQWMSMRLEVTPSTLVWSRLGTSDVASVVATDARFRGGYLHIGRHSADGSLSLRRLRVDPV